MTYMLKPIRTESDYQSALKAAEAFFDADSEPVAGSEEEATFEALVTLIEAYEKKHYPISSPSPIEAIRFRMEQGGLSIADMKPYIGPSHRVYEVLNGSRKLSLSMIRRLVTLGIPADVLIGQELPLRV